MPAVSSQAGWPSPSSFGEQLALVDRQHAPGLQTFATGSRSLAACARRRPGPRAFEHPLGQRRAVHRPCRRQCLPAFILATSSQPASLPQLERPCCMPKPQRMAWSTSRADSATSPGGWRRKTVAQNGPQELVRARLRQRAAASGARRRFFQHARTRRRPLAAGHVLALSSSKRRMSRPAF